MYLLGDSAGDSVGDPVWDSHGDLDGYLVGDEVWDSVGCTCGIPPPQHRGPRLRSHFKSSGVPLVRLKRQRQIDVEGQHPVDNNVLHTSGRVMLALKTWSSLAFSTCGSNI